MKTGDIVALRSGGPEMTVLSVGHDIGDVPGEVECGWFAKGRRFETEDFPMPSLIMVRPLEDEVSK